jgi:hypothetical protein
MNKRLLHLFREAGFHQPEMERLGIEDKFAKFAELIVLECVNLVDDMADSEDSDGYFWTIQNVSQKIKKHFGVEE